jgi:D-xylose transport system substrate-binding protein
VNALVREVRRAYVARATDLRGLAVLLAIPPAGKAQAMRGSTYSFAAVGSAVLLTLAACSSGGGSSSSGSSSGGNAQGVSAICKLTNPPKSSASAPPTSSASPVANPPAGVSVGVILPDTTSSTRYTLYDQPLLKAAFDAAGLKSDIQNSQGDTTKQSAIASSMIGEGVKVLLLDSIDQSSGAAIEQQAAAAGVQVIDYDRVNLGGNAAYYVSFDNEEVGTLQAQTLVDCLNQAKASKPRVIMMDGGTDVDNNAVLFAKGANDVLKPLASDKKLTVESETVVKGWKTANAAPAFEQALSAAGGQVEGVVAANDDIANAVIGVLQQQGLNGHVVLTGQDSQVEGLQNILKGDQSMTIFKNVSLEANAAAKLAIALIGGQDPTTLGITFSDKQLDPKNSALKSVLLPPEVITYNNVQDVITAGALKASDVCNGIQDQCDKAGVK